MARARQFAGKRKDSSSARSLLGTVLPHSSFILASFNRKIPCEEILVSSGVKVTLEFVSENVKFFQIHSPPQLAEAPLQCWQLLEFVVQVKRQVVTGKGVAETGLPLVDQADRIVETKGWMYFQ